jgi:hypothetical protein
MSKYSSLFNTLRRLFAKKEIAKQTKYINQRFGKDNLNPIDDNIPLDNNRNIDFQRLHTEKEKIKKFLNKKNKKSMGGAVGPNGML